MGRFVAIAMALDNARTNEHGAFSVEARARGTMAVVGPGQAGTPECLQRVQS